HLFDRAIVAGSREGGSGDFAGSEKLAAVCGVFVSAHTGGLCHKPGVRAGLWIRGREIEARGDGADSAAGHPAIDSGPEFSSWRDAGDGGAVSEPATGSGVGVDHPDIYGTSLEHRVQFLFVVEDGAARFAGSGDHF